MSEGHKETPETAAAPTGLSARAKIVVIAIVILVFGFVLISRGLDGASQGVSTGGQNGQATTAADPVAALDDALEEGKPIYVLFHSQGCASCLEMEQAAARVLPEYAGELTFVDVLTNDPRARELIQRYPFQYIPTSFFLDENGEVVESYTGSLTDDDMRDRFDALVAASATAPLEDAGPAESEQPAEQ